MPNLQQINDLLNYGIKYYNTTPVWEQEVGNFLAPNKNMMSKQRYDKLSNDIRHQYASAIVTREANENVAKGLGDLNEFFNFNASGTADTERDQVANTIGRNYALQHPNLTNQELLKNLYDMYVQKHGL